MPRRPPLLGPGLASVQLREPRHERESDPGAGSVRCGVHPRLEGAEDPFAVLGQEPRTVVLDRRDRAAVAGLDPDPDVRVRGRVSSRVHQQVLDDPLDLRDIDRDGGRGRVDASPLGRRPHPIRRPRSAPRRRGRRSPAGAPRGPATSRSGSNRSVTSRSSLRALPAIRRTRSRWTSGSSSTSSRSSVSALPSKVVSGVRRSCETACRNVLFSSSSERRRAEALALDVQCASRGPPPLASRS
mgnify:CR=1 FL=1